MKRSRLHVPVYTSAHLDQVTSVGLGCVLSVDGNILSAHLHYRDRHRRRRALSLHMRGWAARLQGKNACGTYRRTCDLNNFGNTHVLKEPRWNEAKPFHGDRYLPKSPFKAGRHTCLVEQNMRVYHTLLRTPPVRTNRTLARRS